MRQVDPWNYAIHHNACMLSIGKSDTCCKNDVRIQSFVEDFLSNRMLTISALLSTLYGHFASMGACFGMCIEYTSNDEHIHNQRVQMALQQECDTSESNTMSSMVFFEGNTNSKSFRGDFSTSTSSLTSSMPLSDFSSADMPYCNHGLILWNEQRRIWLGDRSSSKQQRPHTAISWTPSYDSLLGTSRPFVQPIPLPAMVSFLVRVWEEEGLYD